MQETRKILCASNAYNRKYFFNDEFSALPQGIREELQILCVMFTEDVGGLLTIGYEEDGAMYFDVTSDSKDLMYDEIGGHLKAKQLQRDKRELWEALEMYYKLFFLQETQ